MSIIWFLIIGIIAGWLAGLIMRGRGFGIVTDLILGVLGAVIGGWALRWIGIVTFGLVGSLIAALVGAVILIGLVRLVRSV